MTVIKIIDSSKVYTVNSRLADTSLLWTLAIPDSKRRSEGVCYNESWLHGNWDFSFFLPWNWTRFGSLGIGNHRKRKENDTKIRAKYGLGNEIYTPSLAPHFRNLISADRARVL